MTETCIKGKKVIIGLSGGVDSAVAALLLKKQGAIVEAIHMTNWEDDKGYCNACLLYTSPSPRDRQKSRMPSSA